MVAKFPLVCLDPGHRRVGLAEVGLVEMDAATCMRETIQTAQALEQIGFSRYWLGEHHAQQSFHANPELVAALLAERTTTIRIGTAGVLLPYSRPFKVAEAFRSLAAWFPGRIDAGFAKGPGADPNVIPDLIRESGFDPGNFRNDLQQLTTLLSGNPGKPIAPHETPNIQLWCHSSNPETLRTAARLGMGIGIALFLQKDKTERSLETIGQTIQTNYVDHFKPGSQSKPSIVAVEYLLCLDDPQVLRGLRQLPSGPWGTGHLGTPDECAAVAEMTMQATGATEFGVFQAPFIPALMRKSCRLLAQALGARARIPDLAVM